MVFLLSGGRAQPMDDDGRAEARAKPSIGGEQEEPGINRQRLFSCLTSEKAARIQGGGYVAKMWSRISTREGLRPSKI